MNQHTGQCQCGAVTYRAEGLRDIWFCHCRQCRSLTGHYMAACRTERERIDVTGEVRWTAVSQRASHGFCASCSAPLFWSNSELPTLSVLAGSLDSTTGLSADGHLYVAEKGDYYSIDDGLPQFAGRPAERL
ncbi:GFA family protein [Novosphingobium sp.]|uniref:GFA family protein n=1 Tax=Novosphingobium sp. TaxID=1874826 RepID=UPI002869ED59|nr:GFA family protein [Novosphingobium sp.]